MLFMRDQTLSSLIFTVKGYSLLHLEVFNMWGQSGFKTDVQCVAVKPFTLHCPPAKQALTHCSPTHSPHPSGTTTGRMPCVFVLDTLCLQCSTSSQSQCGSGRHRGQTGRCPFWADGKKSSRETCLVVREEIKNVEKRERKQDGRERKRARDRERVGERKRVFQLAGKQARRRAEGSKGIYAIDISTHQLIVIALAHKLHIYFTQTEA